MRILKAAMSRLKQPPAMNSVRIVETSPQRLLLGIFASAAAGILVADLLFTAVGYGIQDTEAKPWILLGLWIVGVKFLMTKRSADRREVKFRIW
jgi:hypothetical protein